MTRSNYNVIGINGLQLVVISRISLEVTFSFILVFQLYEVKLTMEELYLYSIII